MVRLLDPPGRGKPGATSAVALGSSKKNAAVAVAALRNFVFAPNMVIAMLMFASFFFRGFFLLQDRKRQRKRWCKGELATGKRTSLLISPSALRMPSRSVDWMRRVFLVHDVFDV
jgi:hypothetical protein